MEPLFADLGTLSAHREEDEDFGAFLEENPEFFVDFGDDPFEDVPSTSVEENDHNNGASTFVFDTKVHQNDCAPVDSCSATQAFDDAKPHDESTPPSSANVPQIVSIADPPDRPNDASEAPAPEDLLLCKAISFDAVTGDVPKADSVIDDLVVKPDSILVQPRDLKSEPTDLIAEPKTTEQPDATVATVDGNGAVQEPGVEGSLTSQETPEPPPTKKLKPKPSPLCITQTQLSGTSAALNSPTPYQSLLRSPLLATAPHSPPPYTPPPMLSPCRKATGLFSSIDHASKGEP